MSEDIATITKIDNGYILNFEYLGIVRYYKKYSQCLERLNECELIHSIDKISEGEDNK